MEHNEFKQLLTQTIINKSKLEFIAPSMMLPTRLTITILKLDESLKALEEVYDLYNTPIEQREKLSIEVIGTLNRMNSITAIFKKEENITDFIQPRGMGGSTYGF